MHAGTTPRTDDPRWDSGPPPRPVGGRRSSSTPSRAPASSAGPAARAVGRARTGCASSPPRRRRNAQAIGPAGVVIQPATRTGVPAPMPLIVRRAISLNTSTNQFRWPHSRGSRGSSPAHLHREFKRTLGVSPREYQAACRADRFRKELQAGRAVTTAMYDAGYGSPSRIYESAPTGRGMPPAAYRRGGAGADVGFTTVRCPLGWLLVAATDRGVCAVKLGDSREALEADLRREFSSSVITPNHRVRPEWVTALVDRLRGTGHDVSLPLDVRGTAFQWRVWRALQQIPAGETRSYSDIAQVLGRPSAVRAVANACARNPVCLVVPCHRCCRQERRPGRIPLGRTPQRTAAGERDSARAAGRPGVWKVEVRSRVCMTRTRYGVSPWIDQVPKRRRPDYPRFQGTHDYLAVIVGGGLTGTMTAYAFAAAGVNVALLEADRIGVLGSGAGAGRSPRRSARRRIATSKPGMAEKWPAPCSRRRGAQSSISPRPHAVSA